MATSQLKNLVIVKMFSVNLLYLILHSAAGHFKEKNNKHLIRQRNMKKFGLELDHKLKHLMVEKNCFRKKNHARIGINTGDDLPLNKPLNFSH